MKHTNKGFTLVELLVVIAIIGLLAGIAVVSVNSTRAKARDARRIADIKQMQNALELYNNTKNGQYPSAAAVSTLGVDVKTISSDDVDIKDNKTTGEVYLNVVSKDPGTTAYTYQICAAPCAAYTIDFTTEGATTLGAAGNYKATPTGISQ